MNRPENFATASLIGFFDSGCINVEQLNELVRRLRDELDEIREPAIKIADRLSACESERDELKSKLAQFEREIPKTPEGFPELDKDHLIKICIHQQSKLAEIDSRESAAVKTLSYMGYTHNGGELWKPPIGRQYAFLGDTILNAPSHKTLDFGMFKINVTNQKVEVDFNKPLTMIKEEGFQCVVRPHESFVPNTDWAKVRPTLGVNDLKGSTTVGTIAFAGHLKENMVSIGDEHPWKFTSTEDCSNDLVNPPIIKELYQNSWLRPLGSKDEPIKMDFVKSNSNPEIIELNDIKPSQPIANNSEPAQRITEQDAREIWVHGYESGHNEGVGCGHSLAPRCRHKGEDEFYADDISDLLAKLNEHREVIPNKAEVPRLGKVEGDVLPPIGENVFIYLASRNEWVKHKVVGYYVWKDLKGQDHLHRVFVRVIDEDGILNARLLSDVRRVPLPPLKGDDK